MIAYSDKVLVEHLEREDVFVDVDLRKAKVISSGHTKVGENDPLEVGDIVYLEQKALGVPFLVKDKKFYIYRKHQILVIDKSK